MVWASRRGSHLTVALILLLRFAKLIGGRCRWLKSRCSHSARTLSRSQIITHVPVVAYGRLHASRVLHLVSSPRSMFRCCRDDTRPIYSFVDPCAIRIVFVVRSICTLCSVDCGWLRRRVCLQPCTRLFCVFVLCEHRDATCTTDRTCINGRIHGNWRRGSATR